MHENTRWPSTAMRQATMWSTRLSKLRITNDELRRFRAWRREPANRVAYEQLLEGLYGRGVSRRG